MFYIKQKNVVYPYCSSLISAFPGTGKTYFFEKNKDNFNILDSDSSTFDKNYFPDNYITHIKNNYKEKELMLISSHKVVRDSLIKNNLRFLVVYPALDCKDIYIKRFKERNNTEAFIERISSNWEDWINEIEDSILFDKIRLNKNNYLSDVIFLN